MKIVKVKVILKKVSEPADDADVGADAADLTFNHFLSLGHFRRDFGVDGGRVLVSDVLAVGLGACHPLTNHPEKPNVLALDLEFVDIIFIPDNRPNLIKKPSSSHYGRIFTF